ncbi:hypothetical protein GP486_005998, partial [Trichoglossum hirsutum]
ITRPNQSLAVLHSHSDNTPIANFPQNHAAISDLTGADLGMILRDLELSLDGERRDKEARLRAAIGLLEWAV